MHHRQHLHHVAEVLRQAGGFALPARRCVVRQLPAATAAAPAAAAAAAAAAPAAAAAAVCAEGIVRVGDDRECGP